MLKLRYKITNFINFIKHHLRIIAHKSTYIAFFTLFERKVIGVILAIAGIIGLFVSLLIRIEYEEPGNQFFLIKDQFYQVIVGTHAFLIMLFVMILVVMIQLGAWVLGLQIYQFIFRVVVYIHRICTPLFKKVKVWLQPLFRWFHLYINFNRCCLILIYISLGSFIYAYWAQIIEALRFIFRNEDIYMISLIFIMTIIFYIIVTLRSFRVNVGLTDGNIVFGLIFFILLVSWKLNLGVSLSDCFQEYNQYVIFFIFFILLILNFLSAKLKNFSIQLGANISSQTLLLIFKLSFNAECSNLLFITVSVILSLFLLIIFFQDCPKINAAGILIFIIIITFLIVTLPSLIVLLDYFANVGKIYILEKLLGIILIGSLFVSAFMVQNIIIFKKIGLEIGLILSSSILLELNNTNTILYTVLIIKILLLYLHLFYENSYMGNIKKNFFQGLEILQPEFITIFCGIFLLPIIGWYYILGIKWCCIILNIFITNWIFIFIFGIVGIFLIRTGTFYRKNMNVKISMIAAAAVFIPHFHTLHPAIFSSEQLWTEPYAFTRQFKHDYHRPHDWEHYLKRTCAPCTIVGWDDRMNFFTQKNFSPNMKWTLIQLFRDPRYPILAHYYSNIILGTPMFAEFIKSHCDYIGTHSVFDRSYSYFPPIKWIPKSSVLDYTFSSAKYVTIPTRGLTDKFMDYYFARPYSHFSVYRHGICRQDVNYMRYYAAISSPFGFSNYRIFTFIDAPYKINSAMGATIRKFALESHTYSWGYSLSSVHNDRATMTLQNHNSSAVTASTNIMVQTESSRSNPNNLGYSISAFSDNDRAIMALQDNNSSAAVASTNIRVHTESSRYNPNNLGDSISAFSDNDRAIMALQDNNSSAAVASTNIRVHTESSRYNPNNLGDSISAFSDNDRAIMDLQDNNRSAAASTTLDTQIESSGNSINSWGHSIFAFHNDRIPTAVDPTTFDTPAPNSDMVMATPIIPSTPTSSNDIYSIRSEHSDTKHHGK